MTIYKGETSLETRKQAEEMLAELRRQAYAEGYEQGKFDQRMEMAIDEVSEIVNGNIPRETGREFLEKQRKETSQESMWTDNVNPPTMDELMTLGKEVLSESAQEKRDRIVEQAKADVEDRFFEGHHGVGRVIDGH